LEAHEGYVKFEVFNRFGDEDRNTLAGEPHGRPPDGFVNSLISSRLGRDSSHGHCGVQEVRLVTRDSRALNPASLRSDLF
jgi:hypothetical protein